jgi:hypothetical protein
VQAGYRFWFMDMDRPDNKQYATSPWNQMRDLRETQSMGVFPTESGFGTGEAAPQDNVMLADTGLQWPSGSVDGPLKRVLANDLFRAVHDAFGHGMEGAGFREQGEENAWQAHVRLFTGSAVGAITSETRGQNSWLNFKATPYRKMVGDAKAEQLHPDNWQTISVGEHNRTAKVEDTVFAEQKTGLMPEWTWTEGRADDAPAFSRRVKTDTPEFKRWFGDSKVVDEQGRPLVIYRGVRGGENIAEGALNGEARGGYASFGSDSPYVANTYGTPDFEWGESGALTPLYVKADRLIEFPVQERADGTRTFSKTEFDRRAQALRPGEVLVARQVLDLGPNSRQAYQVDKEKKYTDYSDIYAWGPGTSIKSATGNSGAFDPANPDIRFSRAQPVNTQVPDQDVFEEFGRFAENRIDADRAWADGDHVFAVAEMDEEPTPVTSPQMLAAYTPDQLMIIRARDWSPSEPAAPDQAEVASLFRDLQDARGLGRVRALERVDAHPMAETIRRIDEEFMDILERLDDAGLVKINCK